MSDHPPQASPAAVAEANLPAGAPPEAPIEQMPADSVPVDLSSNTQHNTPQPMSDIDMVDAQPQPPQLPPTAPAATLPATTTPAANAPSPAMPSQNTPMRSTPANLSGDAERSGSRAPSAHPEQAFTMPTQAIPHGAPVRQYLNTKVTGTLMEGMKMIAKEQPKDPLKVLGEFLLAKSKELEA